MRKLKPQNSLHDETIDLFRDSISFWDQVRQMPYLWSGALSIVVASGLITVFSLFLPLTLMQVYDRVIKYQSIDTLTWLVIACTIAFLLEGSLRFARAWIGSWMAARFEHDLSCSAVERLLQSPLADFQREEVGVHLDRINAVSSLKGYYAGQVFQMLFDLPFFFLFLIAIYYIGGSLIVYPLGMIVLYLLLIAVLRRGLVSAQNTQSIQTDRRYNFLIEILDAIGQVKNLTMEEQMLRRYERLQANAAISNMIVSQWQNTVGNLGFFFSQAIMFGTIGFGASRVIDGSLTIGGLTACTMIGGRALGPIQSAASFWLRFAEAKLYQEKVAKIAACVPDLAPGSLPFPSRIEGSIETIGMSYLNRNTGTLLFDELNLKIKAGEFAGILCADPVVASTLLLTLCGVYRPTTGRVLIDSYDIFQWDRTSLQGRIEYLTKDNFLFKGTILENITLFDPTQREAALDAAALVELDEMVAQLPKGYETPVGGNASNTLPTGMLQRVALARALVVRPRILMINGILDSMDRDTADILNFLLKKLRGNCTVILISEHMHLVEDADSIFSYENGNLECLTEAG